MDIYLRGAGGISIGDPQISLPLRVGKGSFHDLGSAGVRIAEQVILDRECDGRRGCVQGGAILFAKRAPILTPFDEGDNV